MQDRKEKSMWNRLRRALIASALIAFVVLAIRFEFAGQRNSSLPAVFAQASPFADYHGEQPGKVHKITAADLPEPYASSSVANFPRLVEKPRDAWPQVPPGFKVELYARQLANPRLIRTAPNGDIFVADSMANNILVFRGITKDGKPEKMETFASDLNAPFGIAFYPPGPNPHYIYVGNTDSVVRFPYENGDLKVRGKPEVLINGIPTGGHWTRDVVFSADGKRMFVSVGSRSNVIDTDKEPNEFHRANILVANPDGSDLRVHASGIRNPVSLAVDSRTGVLWTSVNERDLIGDNLPPDYITHVQENGFYGWPWYYIGGNQDPRLKGKHPELKDRAIVPDVLLEPHNASLGMTFYEGTQFPRKYRDGIFASEHGSWNRSVRTGYEVIFVPRVNGNATGEYEDFLTGLVTPGGDAWGRPVGVAVATDGSLLVTDDGSNSIWRVSYGEK